MDSPTTSHVLSIDDRQLADLLVNWAPTPEISETLGIPERAVRFRIRDLLIRFGVFTQAELYRKLTEAIA